MNSYRVAKYFTLSAAVATVLAIGGCSPSIQSQVVGSWQISQVDQVADRLDQQPGDSDQQSESKMKIQFRKDGTMRTETRMGTIHVNKEGNWRLVSEDAAGCKIECMLSDQVTTHEIQFVDPTTIKLAPPNMAGVNMKLEFKRAE